MTKKDIEKRLLKDGWCITTQYKNDCIITDISAHKNNIEHHAKTLNKLYKIIKSNEREKY